MSRLDVKKIIAGTLFYECASGMNLEAVALDAPQITDELDGKNQYRWTARNTQTGEDIAYAITEGYESYGPRIYTEAQYVFMKNGKFEFPLYGGNPIVPGDPRTTEHHTPAALLEYIKDAVLLEYIKTPPGTSFGDFYERFTQSQSSTPSP